MIPVLVRLTETRWVNLTFVKTITVEPLHSAAPEHIVVRVTFTDGTSVTTKEPHESEAEAIRQVERVLEGLR